jgi:hypothetical protein
MPHLRFRLGTLVLLVVIIALASALLVQQQRLRVLQEEVRRLKNQVEVGMNSFVFTSESPANPPEARTPVGAGGATAGEP